MPHVPMLHDVDPTAKLLSEIGDISGLEIFNNQVLVAVYIRPTKTKSGIYFADKTIDEDRHQSKVGLIVKKGPTAFDDPNGEWFQNESFEEKDWVVFRPSDGWPITVNNVLCRILQDVQVRGRVTHPDLVY